MSGHPAKFRPFCRRSMSIAILTLVDVASCVATQRKKEHKRSTSQQLMQQQCSTAECGVT